MKLQRTPGSSNGYDTPSPPPPMPPSLSRNASSLALVYTCRQSVVRVRAAQRRGSFIRCIIYREKTTYYPTSTDIQVHIRITRTAREEREGAFACRDVRVCVQTGGSDKTGRGSAFMLHPVICTGDLRRISQHRRPIPLCKPSASLNRNTSPGLLSCQRASAPRIYPR